MHVNTGLFSYRGVVLLKDAEKLMDGATEMLQGGGERKGDIY